jgi:ABC-type nitrate/sulfonate/bicarbonate transport system permease component
MALTESKSAGQTEADALAEAAVPPRSVVRPPRWRRKLGSNTAIDVMAIGGLLAAWEIIPRLIALSWLPPLTEVIGALFVLQERGELWPNLFESLRSLGVGFAMAVTLGIAVGALMGRFRWVDTALNVYVDALLFTPGLILAPIFFAIFGLGSGTRIAVVFVYALPIIIINVATAVKCVDRSLVEMATSYGCTRRRMFRAVLLPAAMPISLEGVRLGLGRGIKGMINGEVLIAMVGLGGVASKYGGRMDTATVWSITLVVAIIAIVASSLLARVEQKLTHWV